MSRGLKTAVVLSVLSPAVLLVSSVRERLLPVLATWLDVDEGPFCVRYVMVLPGDEINRPLMAAALVRLDLARDVLIPQNPDSADVRDGISLPTAQISRRVLQHRGIPLERTVFLPSESRSTFDDAHALREFLRDHDGDVAVVTSAFHTRRARFVFGKVLGESGGRIRIVAAPNPGFSTQSWWRSRDGSRLILMEYGKLGFYLVRYGGGRFWLPTAGIMMVLVYWRVRRRTKMETTIS